MMMPSHGRLQLFLRLLEEIEITSQDDLCQIPWDKIAYHDYGLVCLFWFHGIYCKTDRFCPILLSLSMTLFNVREDSSKQLIHFAVGPQLILNSAHRRATYWAKNKKKCSEDSKYCNGKEFQQSLIFGPVWWFEKMTKIWSFWTFFGALAQYALPP